MQIGERQLAGGIEGFAGGTTRVSVSSTGVEGNASVGNYSAISPDGRYVAFVSSASNLVTDDTNGVADLFLKDLETGNTTRISTDSEGNQGNGLVWSARAFNITSGGRFVVFQSDASNLVAGDTNNAADTFVKDVQTGVTTRVNTNSAGNQSSSGSVDILGRIRVSDDGRYVAFGSTDPNLVEGDANSSLDVFVKDLRTGATTMVSTSSSGEQSNPVTHVPQLMGMSADGRFILFETDASNLVSDDTNGTRDIFRKDTQTGKTIRVNTTSSGAQLNAVALQYSAISPDGRFVAFVSYDSPDIRADDTNGFSDIFLKDIEAGALSTISTNSAGQLALGGNSRMTGLSADGRYVAFHSQATNLVEGDTNGLLDQFVKDTLTGVTTRVSVDSAGNQLTGGISGAGPISADGRRIIFLSSATNVVTGDTNGVADIFVRDLTRTGVQQMSGMVVSNRISAGVSLNLIQKYKDELTKYRSELGATTSRISTFVNTLQSTNINTQAADSRISDADIAQDSATATAAQIRQQVASSLLGQANQAPRIALRLLQNA